VTGLILSFNYEKISVYVCIYLWPALCVAMPAIVAMVALYNWVKKLTLWNTINLALSSETALVMGVYAKLFYNLYSKKPMKIETGSPFKLDTIHDKFVACWFDPHQMRANWA